MGCVYGLIVTSGGQVGWGGGGGGGGGQVPLAIPEWFIVIILF